MGLLENTATPGGSSHRFLLAASDKEPTETTGDTTHRFQPLNEIFDVIADQTK